MKFNKPTLITLTAPTCSGKSYLLQKLVGLGFQRIVSTTTRAPREGEQEGVDYNFISHEKSVALEEAGEFAELITFRGTRYGVTHEEMAMKMQGELAPIVILEPQGLAVYEEYCREHDWDIFKVYVSTTESIRIERLGERTAADILGAVRNFHEDHLDVFNYNVHFNVHTPVPVTPLQKIIKTHTDRLLSITGEERLWQSQNTWDAIVSGTDINKAITYIEEGIKWRNSPKGVATT